MARPRECARAVKFVSLIFLALGFASVSAKADETYPNRPVRIVVPFSAGGPTDIVGRVFAQKLSELIGQQFYVENKVGAGGNIGADVVAKSPPDGYTLLVATVSTHAINPGLYSKMPYDPLKDFAPISHVGITPSTLNVHPSIPAKNVKELIALVKANPGKYTYGSSGLGSILHLCGEQFKALAGGLEIQHVPYRGSAPMMADLVGGQINMAFDGTPTALPQIQSGAIRAVGAGMLDRMKAMPELPTLQEQGLKGFECYTWNAILAPAGTAPAIVEKLAGAIKAALDDANVVKRLQDAGVDPMFGRGPKETMEFLKDELAKWAPIIKMSGAVVN
ncbi:MAG TPA: tripartite tricarboxylate transporter substrate binding protein [Xanthobacteraceae bacterium]|nr:tripartite tricarboxylate transporter substrate binding protein [Xanthobacteraceae bacterium]